MPPSRVRGTALPQKLAQPSNIPDGRNSLDITTGLEFLGAIRLIWTRCAPGRRALRSGWQLCRTVSRNLKIGHRSSKIDDSTDFRFKIHDARFHDFPTGTRPVPGRSSRDSAKALKYFEDARHHRTHCAPGRRALRSGRQLCRPAGAYLDNPHPVITRSAFAFTVSVAGVVPINSPSSCRFI